MTHHVDTGDQGRRLDAAVPPAPDAPSRRGRWLVGGFAAAALLLLALEHRPHLLGWLPWLILLACPLMHLFMHRGHHHGGRPRTDSAGSERRTTQGISGERETDGD